MIDLMFDRVSEYPTRAVMVWSSAHRTRIVATLGNGNPSLERLMSSGVNRTGMKQIAILGVSLIFDLLTGRAQAAGITPNTATDLPQLR